MFLIWLARPFMVVASFTKKKRMDSFISFFPKKRVPYMLIWVDVDGCDICWC